MMTCADYRHRLSPYLDGLLAPPQRVELEAHMQQCADCRQELASLQQMLRALHTMSAPEGPDLLPGIHARLARKPWWQRLALPLPAAVPWGGAALAATALLVAVVVALPRRLQRAERAAELARVDVVSHNAASFEEQAVRKRTNLSVGDPRDDGTYRQLQEADRLGLERDDKPAQLVSTRGVDEAIGNRTTQELAAAREKTDTQPMAPAAAAALVSPTSSVTLAGQLDDASDKDSGGGPMLIQVQWRVADLGAAVVEVSEWVSTEGGFAVATNDHHLSVKLPAAAVSPFLQRFSSDPVESPLLPASPLWVTISLELVSEL